VNIRRTFLVLLALSLTLSVILIQGCAKPEEEKPSEQATKPIWPKIGSPVPADPIIENKIADYLSRMSLEQKVGQMMQASIDHITPEEVTQYYIGSVLNGGGMYPNKNRNASVKDWVALANRYWEASMNMPEGVPAIPIIWGTDAVHGHNNVIGATIFPHNSALGATRNPELVKEIGKITAREMVATGLDWNFSPTVAIAKNLRWGRTYESFSEDPGLTANLAASMVVGLQGEPGTIQFLGYDRVIATAKHFIGDGATLRGDDQGDTSVSEDELIRDHAAGYFAALSAGAQTVMASYSSWQGTPMHAHHYLLTEVLKNQMGFDGFVISDWNALGHIKNCTRDSCPTAINAGVDMLMVPARPDWQNTIANTIAQVKAGEIPMQRIDDAVSRILRVKLRTGTPKFHHPGKRSVYRPEEYVSSGYHRSVARDAVRQSLVLIKNNNGLLPLSPSSRVLVTGKSANSVAMQSGGWTITWQGTDTSAKDFPLATTVYQGIKTLTEANGGEAILSEDGQYEKKPDVAVVVFGEEPYAEMRGDIQNLQTLEYSRDDDEALNLLRGFQKQSIPTVSIFVAGRPRLVTKELNQSNAFVMAWLPGSEGMGIADVIFEQGEGQRQYDFVGRLPFAWPSRPCPRKDGVNPDPLFKFGYGLSYEQPAEIPAFDEKYPPYQNGCDLPGELGGVPELVFTGSEMTLHLELKSLEKQNVEQTLTWNGLSANVQRAADNSIEVIDLHWQDAPRINAVLQNGKAQSLVANLAKHHALQFSLNIQQAPSEDVWLKMECGHLCSEPIKVTSALKSLPENTWQAVYLPLDCIAEHRTDLHKIDSPLRIDSSGDFALSIRDIAVGAVVENDGHNLCATKAE